MNTIIRLLSIVVTFAIAESNVRAGLIPTFAEAGVSQNTFTINNIGGTVDIDLYLNQTNGEDILTTEGISAVGFQLDYSALPSAQVAVFGDVTSNSELDDFASATVDPNFVNLDAGSTGAIFPAILDPDRIFLGTFRFTATGLGLTTLTANDLAPAINADNFLTGLSTVLDNQITFGSTAAINVVPEPSSLLMLLAASVPVIQQARRRQAR